MPQACMLPVIAGYADTIGFLGFDAFGLMTGNTILLGIGLAEMDPHRAAFYGGIIAVFVTGVLVPRALLHSGAPLSVALTVAGVLHVVCSYYARPIAAPLLALAMGTQDAAATRFGGVSLNAVFVSGNLQKLGEGLVAWLRTRRGKMAAPAAVLPFVLPPWAGLRQPRG